MIDLEQFPLEMREKIKEDIAKHGEWVVSSYIYMAPLWRMIDELKEADPDISWMVTVRHLINFFGTKDPLPVHYVVARETLEVKKISENKAVDMLARELVGACQKFKQFMEKECRGEIGVPFPLEDEKGYLVPEPGPWDGFIWGKDGCNTIDFLFSKFLESHFSKTGKKASIAILKDSEKRFQVFVNSNFDASNRPLVWNNWINKQNGATTLFTPHLSILADIVWEDTCSLLWARESKNVAALTQGVHPNVVKLLSCRVETQEIDSQIHLLHEQKIIANLPTIDPRLIPAVMKGVGSLNSLYHHKLIRFECLTAFENWAAGKPDARLLRFERGYSEISEQLGLKNRQAAAEIKNILHAQAHLNFQFDDKSSGNLIVLSKFRSSTSGREEGIMITLGPQLLPHYTFQTTKRDRLLIPVPSLPPLISSSNSHASQASLQMLIMQLFGDQSISLAEEGSIEITEKMWTELAKESGLSIALVNPTKDRWINDGDDGPRFLISHDNNRFSFGQAYRKEEEFLIEQGLLRKQRQKSGEKSVEARRKKMGG